MTVAHARHRLVTSGATPRFARTQAYLTRACAPACLAALLLGACAGSLAVGADELAMTGHALASPAGALVLERTGSVVLGYHERTEDRTGAGGSAMGSLAQRFGGGATATGGMIHTAGAALERALLAANVSSFTLELAQRTKLLTPDGLAAAELDLAVPEGARLEELEAATFLPSGERLDLLASEARLAEGRLRLRFPGAVVGAVLALRVKFYSQELAGLGAWHFQDGRLPALRSTFRIKLLTMTTLPYVFTSAVPDLNLQPETKLRKGRGVEESAWLVWTLSDLPGLAEGQTPTTLFLGISSLDQPLAE